MIAATEASHTLQNGLTFCFADVVETLELQHLQGQSSHADVVGKYNGRLYIGLFGEPCLAVPRFIKEPRRANTFACQLAFEVALASSAVDGLVLALGTIDGCGTAAAATAPFAVKGQGLGSLASSSFAICNASSSVLDCGGPQSHRGGLESGAQALCALSLRYPKPRLKVFHIFLKTPSKSPSC